MKKISILLLLAFLIMSLSACGEKSTSTSESETQSLEPVATSEETSTKTMFSQVPIHELNDYMPDVECGSNLKITADDVTMLEYMMYDISGDEYDCEKDPGERFLHYGSAYEMLNTYSALYDLPWERATDLERDDPLKLILREDRDIPYVIRVSEEHASYIIENIFNNHLGSPGKPEDTIKDGYYYLDGYYYIAGWVDGFDSTAQMVDCKLLDNGRYGVTLLWLPNDGKTGDDAYSMMNLEVTLRNIDGHRMWTFYKISTDLLR